MKEHVEKLYKLLPDLVKLENRLTDPGEKIVLRETVAQVLNLHDEAEGTVNPYVSVKASMPVKNLVGISTHMKHIFERSFSVEIKQVYQIYEAGPENIAKLRNFGKKSKFELDNLLKRNGFPPIFEVTEATP